MPEFANPFPGNVPREMSHSELVRAILLDLAAELEAVHLYLAHMDATSNEDARKVLFDIAEEELVHAGEFTSLLYRLDPISGAKAQQGFGEVQELLQSKSPYEIYQTSGESTNNEGASANGSFTVGSLKETPQEPQDR